MPPARRATTKVKQAFVWQIGDVKSPTYVVTITKDGITEDVSQYLLPPISVTWNSVREEIDTANLTLDNSNGRFVDKSSEALNPKYTGGEKVIVKFDYGSGTTKIFQGKCHSLKFSRDKIRTASLFARKLPEIVDKKIKGYYTGDAKTLVKNIIDEHFSDVLTYTAFDANAPTSQIEITYDNYAFQVLREIFIRQGWDGYFDNDDNDDGKIDLNGYERGTQTNTNFAFVDTLNIIRINDFGFDILDEYNSIQVKGANLAGENIIYSKKDTYSISSLWQRDLEITENNIDTISEAKERVESELSLRTNLGKAGGVYGIASEKIIPSETIKISSQLDGIFGDFIPTKINFTLEKIATMSVEFERKFIDIFQILQNRINKENAIVSGGNTNDMLYSINLSFDDESYAVSLGDLEIINGQLAVKDGFSSGIAIFRYPTILSETVTEFEVICERTEDFANSTISVSPDNSTYTVLTQENVVYSITAATQPYFKIRLNSATSTLNGVVVRFK